MSNVSVDVRLRPIRFAFLVKPDDRKSVLEIFRVNTCLWGGKFNPIIPFFKRLPTWWERKGYRFENSKQIINGYLDFFEPDFIVEAEEGLADGLGFDESRVLGINDLVDQNNENRRSKYGLCVNDLYRDLYRKEFQFVRRHEHNIIHVKSKNKAFDHFVACNFGSFPTADKLQHLESNYFDAFDVKTTELDSTAFNELYKTGGHSPLDLGSAKFEIDYHEHEDPTLFILDAHQSRDLIDFWNLRAVHQNIIAIPIQWIEESSEFCKDFILKHYRPLPGNPNGVMIRPKSMFSRSITDEKAGEVHKKYLRVDKDGANCLQTWYPPIWREHPDYTFKTMRPTLTASSKKLDVPVKEEKPEIRFDLISPDFASKYANRFRWANVVTLTDWTGGDQIATVFPCDYKHSSFPQFSLGKNLLSTTEGLVIFPEHKNIPERWDLMDGNTALNQWFNDSGIKATLSDAGRATQQIINTLGGFWGVGKLANKGIIKLLDEMSRQPNKKSAHVKEFQNKINVSIGDDTWHKNNLNTLVDRKAVELGLELKCCKCGSWSWYSLKQIDNVLGCDLCLKTFDFPAINPSNSKYSRWAYRVVGAFALPDYAKGGYAAALSIRFFANVVGDMTRSEITWSSGQELTLPSGEKSESDFILWNQRKIVFGNNYPTEIVFGEAKSFGREAFEQKDIDKMKLLSESFPGSILVFSTMKECEELSKNEISMIRKLAEWGRFYDKKRKQSRAPVIVLTGTELFTSSYLDISWKNKGGKHQQLIETSSIRRENLRLLADFTQQLYLDMPSYGEWHEKQWQKKAERRKKSNNNK